MIACQSNHSYQSTETYPQQDLYLDKPFYSPPPLHIETEQEVFALDDAMRAMVQKKLVNNFTAHQKARILLEHLFNDENIALTYAGNANITASQAYHNKVANCMSLTIMAYALAEEAGLNVSFQEVSVPEYWVRNGQYNLLTGHVNLLVKESNKINRSLIWGEKDTRIDFDPFIAKKNFPSRTIQKHTLLAMFYNNKGAEEMMNQNYHHAYGYLKKATLVDNQLSSAWGNLGILYKLNGHKEIAENTYRHAIALKSNNLTSLGNLALLLNKQGRANEAAPIEAFIHKTRIKNPYYHALLANEAFFEKAYPQALRHYKKAIQLDDEQHEFYFGLAKIYYHQNKLTLAKKAMSRAIALTKAKDTQGLYVAKLNFLKDQGTTAH